VFTAGRRNCPALSPSDHLGGSGAYLDPEAPHHLL
jgi:hypothetical protein